MTDKFCKLLSNAVSFRIPGDSGALTFNPCCLYNDYLPFHETLFNRARKKFLEATDFLPGCSKCELKEKTHGKSLRTFSNESIPSNIGDSIYKLEVVLDTTCNAACIQCGADQSSLWRKQMLENSPNKVYHIQPEEQIDKKIDDIAKIVDLSKLKDVHFWGGEPLITDTHLKMIERLGDPKDITLRYTTNSSIFPDDKVLKIWEKFKQVFIGVSIDGIDDKFHYIRWPLAWGKAKRNLESFLTESPSNIEFHVNCCIIPLNVFYVDELGQWLSENFHTSKNGENIRYNFIRGEGTLDIACTPMELREEVWKKIPEHHPISQVLKEVPVIDYKGMLQHINYWDSKRNLDWTKTFKEIVPYFK